MGSLVSVIVPAYNAERFIADALTSVLGQTHHPLECVVVDDGSTDGTAEASSAFGDAVRVIRQQNAGVSVARNVGAREAQGDILAFLDADDLWHPDKLARQLEALEQLPSPGLVSCAVARVDEGLRPLGIRRANAGPNLVEDMVLGGGAVAIPGPSSTLLLPRAVFEAVGGFDPELSVSADWDLVVRVARRFTVDCVSDPLVNYRLHGTNMSLQVGTLESDMRRAYDKLFASPDLDGRLRRKQRRAESHMYRILAGSYFRAGNMMGFVRNAAASIRRDPRALHYFLAYPLRHRCARDAIWHDG